MRYSIINFGKGKIEDIISMLKRIASAEKLEYSEDILKLIAHHSESSFRDAAKIIEEVSMQKIISESELENFLGIRGKNDLLEIIIKKDIKKIYMWIEEFSQNGGNFKSLIEDILDELRVQLLLKKGVTFDEVKPIDLTVGEISRLIKLLLESYQQMKITPIESLPLEIALNEFYNDK